MIDDILQGNRPSKRPPGLNDEDIDSLLRAASARLQTGTEAVQASLQYEGRVWRQVLQRLDRRSTRRPGDPAYAGTDATASNARDAGPADRELDDLTDIVTMRQIMAARLASFSETYRDEVWQSLQDRLEVQGVEEQESSDDSTDQDRSAPASSARRHNARRWDDVPEQYRPTTWRRIRDRATEHERRGRSGAGNPFGRRWVVAAAAAAVVLVALAPIAVTALR